MEREGRAEEAIGDELVDARKAAFWSALAALAQLAVAVDVVRVSRPAFEALVALAYALVLPAIAIMHVRHRDMRSSGAVLATTLGAVTVVVGMTSAFVDELVPAETLLAGMWWWTIGKMWWETSILPRAFGLITAALAVGALAVVVLSTFAEVPIVAVGTREPGWWIAARYVLAAWLAALALVLVRTR